MANVLRLTVGGALTGLIPDTLANVTTVISVSGDGLFVKMLTCPQSAEADVDLTGVTTPGVIFLKNTDAANYITFGPKSGGNMIGFGEVKAGERFPWRLTRTSPTLRWRAHTADCKVEVRLYPD